MTSNGPADNSGEFDDSTSEGNADIDPFGQLTAALEERIAEHSIVLGGEQYQAQRRYLGRVTQDFVVSIRMAWLAFTRYSNSREWLLQSSIDDFLESAIAIVALAHQGVFNVSRRELRYMVESAVKYVFVDQSVPGDTPRVERIAFVSESGRVPRSSVDVVDQLQLRMLPDAAAFRSAVHSAFGALSGYTHLSTSQLNERYRRSERGEFSGFENAATLGAFVRLVVQTYDVVLALIFEGIGPSFTGDLFIAMFDEQPRWTFHKTRFVKQISHSFDYKAERQQR